MTAGGNREFDALGMTADMVADFMDLTDVEPGPDEGLQMVAAASDVQRDYIDPVTNPPLQTSALKTEGGLDPPVLG